METSPLHPSDSLPKKNKTYEKMINTWCFFKRMVHFNCLLYMKIYCDPHFSVSLWLKCDPDSPFLRALTGFFFFWEKWAMLMVKRIEMWLSLKFLGQILRVFVIRRLSDETLYIHWPPPPLLPAQRHIMYVILTFLFLHLMMLRFKFLFFCCFFFLSFFLKLEICVVAYSAWTGLKSLNCKYE